MQHRKLPSLLVLQKVSECYDVCVCVCVSRHTRYIQSSYSPAQQTLCFPTVSTASVPSKYRLQLLCVSEKKLFHFNYVFHFTFVWKACAVSQRLRVCFVGWVWLWEHSAGFAPSPSWNEEAYEGGIYWVCSSLLFSVYCVCDHHYIKVLVFFGFFF